MNADSIAVLRARLPYVDRRALSEAWFSALQLAGAKPAMQRGRKAPRQPGAAPVSAARHRPERAALVASPVAQRRADVAQAANPRALLDAPRLRRAGGAVVIPLPVRLVRYAPIRCSFSIAAGEGRVQIILRRDGHVLRVVAICSARDADLVRRALACAGMHLRLCGHALESTVHPFEGAERR